MRIINIKQGTPEWRNARLGLPTGSGASKLVSPTGQLSKSVLPFAEKLAGDLFAGEDTDSWEGNKYTERGHELEPDARKFHAFKTNTSVTEVGFVTDDLGRYGASPDGLIGKPDAWIGVAEYKCLPKEHLPSLLHYARTDDAPLKFKPQTQMELLVCEVEWVELVYYHNKLTSFIVRQYRDESFIAKLKDQIDICLEHRDETLELLKKAGTNIKLLKGK